MRTLWNCSNYGNDLKMTGQDAQICSHAGKCDSDVLATMQKPYIKKQLAQINPEKLAEELSEYGCWDSEELSDHDANLMRWVWISASDINEER